MKLLGIDFGIKRVGLAVTDAAATLAFPKKTLYRTTRETLFAALLTIIEEEKPELIVIGLPDVQETGDNEPALIVRQIRNFAQALARRTSIPIQFVDETLSSEAALDDLRHSGRHGRRLTEVLDQQAAVRILETFIAAGAVHRP